MSDLRNDTSVVQCCSWKLMVNSAEVSATTPRGKARKASISMLGPAAHQPDRASYRPSVAKMTSPGIPSLCLRLYATCSAGPG